MIIQLLGGGGILTCIRSQTACSENMTAEHRDAIQRVFCCLYIVQHPNKDPKKVCKDIEKLVHLCWDEFKRFEKKTTLFDNIAGRHTSNALQSKSYLWHEKCSLPYIMCLGMLHAMSLQRLLGLGYVNETGLQ